MVILWWTYDDLMMILWSRCDHDFCCAHGTENTLWHWLFNGMNWWKILVCLQPSLSTCLPCFLDSILQAWPQARLQWHFSRCRVSWLQTCWILLNFVDMKHPLARWLAMAMFFWEQVQPVYCTKLQKHQNTGSNSQSWCMKSQGFQNWWSQDPVDVCWPKAVIVTLSKNRYTDIHLYLFILWFKIKM